ncbi:FecCD family ABC transporter permease [Cryptosporangium phraense]|uniref:Iron chelate uptake ABC transporter family permease subunit n=1 Tax=Cryptosporangium phraense TaxID=2593070 RepID=A0A545AZ50_9ACTN|nr:iron chelate uptake ABC transporter family permease subunit [Cryptosporangium phraense]TQS45865.1 iron chelate uptake ABC transporter family permease subunit [Cryptosporangium phraense]
MTLPFAAIRPGPLSVRFRVRTVVVCAVLLALAFAAAVVSLGTGDVVLSPKEVLAALVGQGSPIADLVVIDLRLPRVLLALTIGAALGLSGAIFQALTRNPLGSPDVIGFNTGAFTGVLVVTVFVGNAYFMVAAGALVGGLATALAVYLLAYRRGVQGFRLIIVGIAVNAILISVNQWFVIKVDLQAAYAATIWGQGSLNGLDWTQVPWVVPLIVVLMIGLAIGGSRLLLLELGDEIATGLGVRVEAARMVYLGLGVALIAVATAAAGPIAFVALAAPQLAQRLTGSAGIALAPAAAMGALLLIVSDWVAQHAFAPTQLPVGVVTVTVGGVYFAWVLARVSRTQ